MASGTAIVGAGAAVTVEASDGDASSADLVPQAAGASHRLRIPIVRAFIPGLLVRI